MYNDNYINDNNKSSNKNLIKKYLYLKNFFYRILDLVGLDVLKFDNTYSWTRPKELFYAIKVSPPNVNPELPPDLSSLHSYESDTEEEFFECAEEVTEQELNESGPSLS